MTPPTNRNPTFEETAHREHLQRALGEAYEVGALLGRGGFAEVYAARDLRLKRDVAVKTLRYDLHVTPHLLTRFRREAETMAKLRHPNILPIYSVGEAEDLAYFIMPLITGKTLKEAMDRERRLGLAEARRVLFETANALQHAHQAGTVHRDIKPENIILEGSDRRVWVMDFGIAKVAEAGDGELTGAGVIIGTPQYMSPEQAAGDSLDHRSDLYSLGVVGFQMVTGELPFSAGSPQGMILKHITEEAPRVERHRPECPRDLADVIRRCLAKEPEDRWATAAEMCVALQRGAVEADAGGEAVTTVPLPLPLDEEKPVPDPVRRFRTWLAALVLGGALALTVDLAMNGAVDFAPVLIALAAIPLASRYARLWMQGFGWREVLLGRPAPDATSSGASSGGVVWSTWGQGALGDSGAFGLHLEMVDQVRSERAVVVGLVTRMPKSERERIGDAVPVADGLVARARALARQLTRVDRVIEEAREKSVSSGGARTPSELDEMEARRGDIAAELSAIPESMRDLRVALERCQALGVSGARTDLEVAVAAARARTRGAAGDETA